MVVLGTVLRRRFLIITALILVVVGLGLMVVLRLNRQRATVRTAAGGLITLEAYAFQAGKVRYELPNRPLARMLSKVLPHSAARKVTWLRPETTVYAYSEFPTEPILSAAFSARDSSGNPRRAGTRLAVINDCGELFDPQANFLGNNGVFELPAFPRRGQQLRLRLMEGDKPLAEFKIPNPKPGPHPVWKPTPVPFKLVTASPEITLEQFVSDPTTGRTRCVFQVREHGEPTTTWLPGKFEVSDATGNHWRPRVDRSLQGTNGYVTGSFLGALWPGEDAWKVRVEFRRADKQSNNTCTVEFVAKPESVPNGKTP